MDFDQVVTAKMVSVLHILPKKHLPKKIVLGRASIFSKIFLQASAGKYALPLFTPTAKDIYLYDNEYKIPKEMVHGIGH
jgi:hypothetical protein